jgi:hypothetical protein
MTAIPIVIAVIRMAIMAMVNVGIVFTMPIIAVWIFALKPGVKPPATVSGRLNHTT